MATNYEIVREHRRTWSGFVRLMLVVAIGVALLLGILGLALVR